MLPNQQQWDAFHAAVKKQAGLDLGLYKANQMQRRIIGMVEAQGMKSLDEFTAWILGNRSNAAAFLDKMAINVSELFRNPEKWVQMRTQVIPELLQGSSKLRCWSAGCSYGAEAHTLAMILDAHFSGSHTIVGSDIDQAALGQAREGRFGATDVKGVPKEFRDKYLLQSGNDYVARPELKRYLTFKTQNLLADRFDSGFDLIMCRNVVIYFTDEAKDQLYRRFYDSLRPGGVLFVGSTERINASGEIGYETSIPFFYRKPIKGDKQWRNAS